MNGQHKGELLEIDIVDFMKSMLEQWRGWLVLGIVCAILFSLGKYAVDRHVYNTMSPDINAVDDESFSYSDLVMSAAQNYVMLQAWREYYENAALMAIDPFDTRKLFLTYYVESDSAEEDVAPISTVYVALSQGSDFSELLSGTVGKDYDGINELFTISSAVTMPSDSKKSVETGVDLTENVISYGSVFVLTIVLPKNVDAETLVAIVGDYYEEINREITPIVGEHKVELLSSSLRSDFDSTLLVKQGNVRQSIIQYRKDYASAYDMLTDDEKKTIDKAIEENRMDELLDLAINERRIEESDDYQGLATDEKNLTPTINKKCVVMGFAFGILLYFCLSFLYIVLVWRYRSGDEAASSLMLRSYGSIYEYPYKIAINKFLHDRRVYEWRHQKENDEVSDISRAIVAKARYEAIEELTCIVLGNSSDREREIVKRISEEVSGDGFFMSVLDAPEGLDSIREESFNSFEPVIITIISGETTPRQTVELLYRLKEYGVPVLGMQFVEG